MRKILNIERVLKQERLMLAMTGFNRNTFENLLVTFSNIYEQQILSVPRQRALGGGRKARLCNPQEKLFYILFYFKCYPTFKVAGILFDIDPAQAHYWMHRLQGILEYTLGKKMILPEYKLNNIEQFIERFDGVERVMIDVIEHHVKPHKEQNQRN